MIRGSGGGFNSRLLDSLLRPDETKKWDKFRSVVGKGGSFGDAEVQRALNAGYSMDDVNEYLKWSGITPKGNFAVGGFNREQEWGGAGRDGGGFNTKETPFYRFTGNATASRPAPESPKPATAAEAPSDTEPIIAPGNPELSIPVPDTIRITGENLGIKTKNSSARRSGQINKGTSRLTIPRSSGYQSLNFG
jgi:hypothetical protein